MSTTRKSKPIIGDYRRFDPSQPPDWRWSIAQRHAAARTKPDGWEDPAIHEAVAYLRELSTDTGNPKQPTLRQRYPDLCDAHRLFAGASTLRDEVEARLLCQHVQAVAAQTGMTMGAIICYATVFYDVIDSLTATDKLLSSVIGVYDLHQRGVREADQWKYWALAGGPIILELLIADAHGLPEPDVPNRHLLAEKFRFSLREFVTPMWDKEAMAAIVEEGCQRFGPLWGCEPVDHFERATLMSHMRMLRLALGLSPNTVRPSRPSDSSESQSSVTQPEPESSHDHR